MIHIMFLSVPAEKKLLFQQIQFGEYRIAWNIGMTKRSIPMLVLLSVCAANVERNLIYGIRIMTNGETEHMKMIKGESIIMANYKYGQLLVSKISGNNVVVGFDNLGHHVGSNYMQPFHESTKIEGFCSTGIVEIAEALIEIGIPKE